MLLRSKRRLFDGRYKRRGLLRVGPVEHKGNSSFCWVACPAATQESPNGAPVPGLYKPNEFQPKNIRRTIHNLDIFKDSRVTGIQFEPIVMTVEVQNDHDSGEMSHPVTASVKSLHNVRFVGALMETFLYDVIGAL